MKKEFLIAPMSRRLGWELRPIYWTIRLRKSYGTHPLYSSVGLY
jgi:hypothetical protein